MGSCWEKARFSIALSVSSAPKPPGGGGGRTIPALTWPQRSPGMLCDLPLPNPLPEGSKLKGVWRRAKPSSFAEQSSVGVWENPALPLAGSPLSGFPAARSSALYRLLFPRTSCQSASRGMAFESIPRRRR